MVKQNCITVKQIEMACLLVLTLFILLSIFSNISFAAPDPPVLYDPLPQNNSYVSGGDKTFYVNVTDPDLNTSTVNLFIKSEEAFEWDKYLMSCESINSTDWACSAIVSLDIVGSDTKELFYFEANDTYGNHGMLGNSSTPLTFVVDINHPTIEFLQPENNTYVSGVETIKLRVIDASSGVNSSTVKYSFDNYTWSSMIESLPEYIVEWNTTSLSNNESVIIYAKASDNIGNVGYSWINVIVDNEFPRVLIISPGEGEKISGIKFLEINATDTYSDIDTQSVYYSANGYQRNMDCTIGDGNFVCNEYFDTTLVSDGPHTIVFHVFDNAGNKNSSSVQVSVDNTEVSVTIINPKNNACVGDETYINATVSNVDETVTGVKMKITGEGYSVVKDMTCPADYKCYTKWDVSDLTDGKYTLTANVTNTEGKTIVNSISVNVDNTPPQLVIDSPVETEVNGTIYPKVIVTDENGVNRDSITFNISTYGNTMNCNMHLSGKKYVCASSFNTIQLDDDYYTLYFYAKDSAGNLNSTSKLLLINNMGGINVSTTTTTSVTTSTTTTSPGPGVTTTTKPSITQNPIMILIGGGIKPITIVLGDIQKSIQDALKSWPVKALAIGLILILIVFAIFKSIRLKEVLETDEERIEGDEEQTEAGENQTETGEEQTDTQSWDQNQSENQSEYQKNQNEHRSGEEEV